MAIEYIKQMFRKQTYYTMVKLISMNSASGQLYISQVYKMSHTLERLDLLLV